MDLSNTILSATIELTEKAGSLTDARKEAIDQYIELLTKAGSYSKENWSKHWTEALSFISIYLSDEEKAYFNAKIDKKITDNPSYDEPLGFLKIEVNWDHDFDELKKLESLIEYYALKYPYNLEFQNSLIVYRTHSGSKPTCIDTVREAHTLALKVAKKFNFSEKYSNDNLERSISLYTNLLLTNNQLDKAEDEIQKIKTIAREELIKNPEVAQTTELYKTAVKLEVRVDDYRAFQKLNDTTTQENKKWIESRLSSGERKSIEVLSIFTAIITFIITATISAITKSEFPIAVLSSLALILILFVYLISHISEEKSKRSNKTLILVTLHLIALSAINIYSIQDESKEKLPKELSFKVHVDSTEQKQEEAPSTVPQGSNVSSSINISASTDLEKHVKNLAQ